MIVSHQATSEIPPYLSRPQFGRNRGSMYDTLTDFLKTFSADHSVLWALLVVAVVSTTSLVLFVFWELVLRLLSSRGPLNKTTGHRTR
jgi:hypothetical protein